MTSILTNSDIVDKHEVPNSLDEQATEKDVINLMECLKKLQTSTKMNKKQLIEKPKKYQEKTNFQADNKKFDASNFPNIKYKIMLIMKIKYKT